MTQRTPFAIAHAIKSKHLDRWLHGYARHVISRRFQQQHVEGPRHLLVAICDHFEPRWGHASEAQGDDRVREWEQTYPRFAKQFVDADGCHPRYSFFFPGEEYAPSYLERLGSLVKQGFGEVELHLHHNNDTEDGLRQAIAHYLSLYAKHGHLSRDDEGRFRYAFIHGNWALANARSDGRWCGVDRELPLLFSTGCYADFTFPSAPDECQPAIINQIYWPIGDLSRRRAYEWGEQARVGTCFDDRLLLIQGPLALSFRRNRMPLRIENADLTPADPPTRSRIRTWVSQQIHVKGQPSWVFVKLHTHGAPEGPSAMLLGEGGQTLHRELGAHYNDGTRWKLHYVTAREMYNIAIAAIDGKTGDPHEFRDYRISPPPIAQP